MVIGYESETAISNHTITIHTSNLFDSKRKVFEKDTSIEVNTKTGLITEIYKRTSPLPQPVKSPDIDLCHLTVVPGFVDAHTHVFLHPYAETPAINQIRDESTVERIVRATNHCRAALLAGYTTYRDLGTEGLGDADVHLRDTINRGIIPGPRLFVATEPISSSGGYDVRQENGMPGRTSAPRMSDCGDGPWAGRAAVRRRLGAGADVIKFYADYGKRALRFPMEAWPGAKPIQFPPDGAGFASERNPNLLLFTQEEMDAIVAEAKFARAPVAAHAGGPDGVLMAAKAGVTTIEHGYEKNKDDQAFRIMRDNATIFVPTLSVLELFYPRNGAFETILEQTKEAYEEDVKLACGGDTGPFAHGDNAHEMELMIEAGVPVLDVLQAATLHGWEACGGAWCGRKFGCLEEGCAADIVALKGDPMQDIKALRQVDFVMKDGRVWKQNGNAIGMV